MLILSRYEGESIYIGDDIQITVFETKNGQVFLGIDAPKEIPVHRAEIYYRNKHQQRMGSSHQGSSHQGSSHQGSSHQGSSHQGSSHQGSSHQGSSHQGSSSGNAGYDRPSHHMRGGQGDSSPRQHISHDEAHEADGNIRQESPEKEHHGGVRSFRRRSNSTRVQYRQSRRYPKTAAKPEDDAIEANGNVLAVDGNVR